MEVEDEDATIALPRGSFLQSGAKRVREPLAPIAGENDVEDDEDDDDEPIVIAPKVRKSIGGAAPKAKRGRAGAKAATAGNESKAKLVIEEGDEEDQQDTELEADVVDASKADESKVEIGNVKKLATSMNIPMMAPPALTAEPVPTSAKVAADSKTAVPPPASAATDATPDVSMGEDLKDPPLMPLPPSLSGSVPAAEEAKTALSASSDGPAATSGAVPPSPKRIGKVTAPAGLAAMLKPPMLPLSTKGSAAPPGSGRKATAGPKLKPLVWQKVPKNRLKGTIWQELKESSEGATPIKECSSVASSAAEPIPQPSFDTARFEQLFLAKPVTKPAPLARAASSAVVGGSIALLDAKRANNLAIILSRLKLPFDEIRKAVVDLDAEILSTDAVCALQKCVPTAEEVELVTAADPSALGYAERFVLALGTVPRLRQRLDCFLFKHQFNGLLHRLWAEVKTLTDASSELLASAPLKVLLGVLLRLGNALNAGSHRSGAEGFKLECLTRLAELKSNEGGGNLLQFAVATAAGLEAPEDEPGTPRAAASAAAAATPLESFSAGITSVRAAAKLSTAEVQDEIARLRSGLNLIGDELAALRKGGARREGDAADEAKHLAGERFLLVMQPFFDGCKGQVEELERSVVEMVEAQGKMKTYFSEEAKANVDELYSRWATFLGHVDAAVSNVNEDRRKAARRK